MPTSAELATKIAEYDKNKKSSADILNEAMTKYGVPEIRGRVAGLRTTLGNTEAALNAVDPSVTGRTSRSLVTEAQRQRMVANERAPIASQYGEQSRALGTESANMTDAERAAETLARGTISDYTTGRQALQGQYETTYQREQNDIAQQTARQQEAERIRQFNESQALAKLNADREYQLALNKASTPSKPTKTDTMSSLTEDIAANIGSDWRSKGNFWTEKTLIPELVRAYPELSESEIKSRVYALRKQYE